ncbi:hypothetical protein P7C70_g515, partial [Phenoliferia sp. Uapishka_3]
MEEWGVSLPVVPPSPTALQATTPSSTASTESSDSDDRIVFPPTVLSNKNSTASLASIPPTFDLKTNTPHSGPYYSSPPDHLNPALGSRTSFSTCPLDTAESSSSVGERSTTPASSHQPLRPRKPSLQSEHLSAIFSMANTNLPSSAVADALDLANVTPQATASTSAGEFGLSQSRSKSSSQINLQQKYQAIGPRGGAKFLASEAAQAERMRADNLEEGFSIRNEVASSDDSSRSASPTAARKFPDPLSAWPPASKSHVADLPSALTGGESTTPRMNTAPEGSIQRLTTKASAEDELIKAAGPNGSGARQRRASVAQGMAAGLHSPFNGSVAGKKDKSPEDSRHPPAAGSSARQRTRSDASTSSTSSTNKDFMLSQLADALKKERRRCEMYTNEILTLEQELDEVELAMSVSKEKFEAIITKQKETIENLWHELGDLGRELESANDLAEEDAEKYLALIGSSTPRTIDEASLLSRGKEQERRFQEAGVSSSDLVKSPKSKITRRLDARLDGADLDAPPSTLFQSFRRPRKLSKSRPAPKKDAVVATETKAVVESPATAVLGLKPSSSQIRRVPPPSPVPEPAQVAQEPRIVQAPPPPAPAPKPTTSYPPVSGTNAVNHPPVSGANGSNSAPIRQRKNSLSDKFTGTLRNPNIESAEKKSKHTQVRLRQSLLRTPILNMDATYQPPSIDSPFFYPSEYTPFWPEADDDLPFECYHSQQSSDLYPSSYPSPSSTATSGSYSSYPFQFDESNPSTAYSTSCLGCSPYDTSYLHESHFATAQDAFLAALPPQPFGTNPSTYYPQYPVTPVQTHSDLTFNHYQYSSPAFAPSSRAPPANLSIVIPPHFSRMISKPVAEEPPAHSHQLGSPFQYQAHFSSPAFLQSNEIKTRPFPSVLLAPPSSGAVELETTGTSESPKRGSPPKTQKKRIRASRAKPKLGATPGDRKPLRFINFTQKDSRALVSAVAPSGPLRANKRNIKAASK